ncbi:energy-coupling factor transporter transmembrane protein EcfT [Paenibacillus thiaminolyticus]|uniref:energy-coupling factor transporter transmembrane component T family protein n=1 Tax=Paenibacillus thiaminolyticus TaxID=49283 RepID=UPI00232FD495|nr:energy-coupling factor transporter transmembrane component T [Paenibacillus thiaminolyticus]WCF08834.1 energy-coupling factor transporter transmembrane protein EcfT [Paenibacillus thiaminolyticus]
MSWLLRIDPLTKGVWLLSTGLAVMISMKVEWQAGWFLAVLLIALSGSGWTARRWRLVSLWIGGFALPLLLFQWLVLPGDTPWLTAGKLTLTREAGLQSAALTLRAMTLFLSSLVFAGTTAPRDVVLAMSRYLRLPDRFAYAAAIALRFVPILLAETARIRHAERLRRLVPPHSAAERLERLQRVIAGAAAHTLRRVQDIATAMEAKRFGAAPRTYRRQLVFAAPGIGLALASVLGAAATWWCG